MRRLRGNGGEAKVKGRCWAVIEVMISGIAFPLPWDSAADFHGNWSSVVELQPRQVPMVWATGSAAKKGFRGVRLTPDPVNVSFRCENVSVEMLDDES